MPRVHIVDRYIGRQIIVAMLMGVAILSLVFVFGNLFKKVFELLVDQDLPLQAVLKFMAYILPFSLTWAIVSAPLPVWVIVAAPIGVSPSPNPEASPIELANSSIL